MVSWEKLICDVFGKDAVGKGSLGDAEENLRIFQMLSATSSFSLNKLEEIWVDLF